MASLGTHHQCASRHGSSGIEELTISHLKQVETSGPSTSPMDVEEPQPKCKLGLEGNTGTLFKGYDSTFGFEWDVSKEEEERRDGQLAMLTSIAIEESKSELLSVLDWHVLQVQDGSLKLAEGITKIAQQIVLQAKGKNTKAVDISSFKSRSRSLRAEYYGNYRPDLTTSDHLIEYRWYLYSGQCLATETDLDGAIVARAKIILELVEKDRIEWMDSKTHQPTRL